MHWENIASVLYTLVKPHHQEDNGLFRVLVHNKSTNISQTQRRKSSEPVLLFTLHSMVYQACLYHVLPHCEARLPETLQNRNANRHLSYQRSPLLVSHWVVLVGSTYLT